MSQISGICHFAEVLVLVSAAIKVNYLFTSQHYKLLERVVDQIVEMGQCLKHLLLVYDIHQTRRVLLFVQKSRLLNEGLTVLVAVRQLCLGH